MRSRLQSIPIYESRLTSVGASHYNLVRLALLRIKNPLRVRLNSLHSLDLLLDDETWIVVDRSISDKPMLAWLDFATETRCSLSAPLPCRINYYHTQSAIIVDKVLEVLSHTLNAKLLRLAENINPHIIPIKKPPSGGS